MNTTIDHSMLRSINQLYGSKLRASDGEIGHVSDLYFDDQQWTVRYVVADTGSWIPGRLVLIPPQAVGIGSLRQEGNRLPVNLTRKQIEDSPPIESHKPVSLQYEEEYFRYYGWPAYPGLGGMYGGGGMSGVAGFPVVPTMCQMPEEETNRRKRSHNEGNPHLRSTQAINGYHIQYTGRLPKDKFFVREPSSESKISWGKVNRPIEPTKFESIKQRLCAYLQGKDLFIQNCYAGADERYRVPVRIISEHAWPALFARNMFIREVDPGRLSRHQPEFTVIHAPNFHADPAVDGTHSEAFVLLHFGQKLILIGGTAYAGEIKKSIFTVMNYLLPQRGVMAMHSSANYGKDENDVAIDTRTRHVNLDDASLTENTRAAYPITQIPNMTLSGRGGHPKHIIMLTCDAFGVLPPLARLTPQQAMYYFLSGYTAKVAGTEAGITEPEATFSACFGAPFMALPPLTYAQLLGERIAKHNVAVWLINTGWSGGPYGQGQRIKLSFTRAMVKAVLSGALTDVPMQPDSIFGIYVPDACPGVPSGLLKPRQTWKDAGAFDKKARELAGMFEKNFFENAPDAPAEVKSAGPKLA